MATSIQIFTDSSHGIGVINIYIKPKTNVVRNDWQMFSHFLLNLILREAPSGLTMSHMVLKKMKY